MEFFGLTSYGASDPIKFYLKPDYKEAKTPPKISDVIRERDYQRPFSEAVRELDIYSGILDGYAYRSVHRLSKLKKKGFPKPIGPSDTYKNPITQSMVHGWFLNDIELQDANWYKPYRYMPKPCSESSKFIEKAIFFSTSDINAAKHSCRLLVVGGGAGGCTVAAKFSKQMKKDDIIILEPAEKHYYQPMFTLIGGGIKKLEDSYKLMKEVLPTSAKWLKNSAVEFDPKSNTVTTDNGDIIEYEYLLVAMGLQTYYNQIPGLEDALSIPSGPVCSNYSSKYVDRTYEALQKFQSGNAIFTYPNTPVKCPGAPQKILYIAEEYFRKTGKRDKANLIYNSSLAVIFGVKKYADALWKIVKQRNINVNLRTNLIEIKPDQNIAVFQNLDKPEVITETEYSLLHVTPPMGAPEMLQKNTELTNDAGFLDVNKDTLQHTKYPNVFGIGDCTNSPNSKTAASVAAQSKIVHINMTAVMAGSEPKMVYNGYASCPLVTGYSSCILAEFDYNLTPTETFPFSQDREMYIMYMMKKDIMPPLYWKLMLNGYWNGPGAFRKLMHPFN
ncbi:uncharacterized protein CBL_08805 [Carabus blaptoides fortunei]